MQSLNNCSPQSPHFPLFQLIFKVVMGLLAIASLTACARTVTWEEEVLLNTGEIIWVNKKVTYTIQGQAGNPLDLRYSSDRMETISFKYGGKNYMYKGDASIFMLAISPEKVPVFVAIPASFKWDYRNGYKCVIPYYVQLIPDATGQSWSWPEKIDSWTYNLPGNLYIVREGPSKTKEKYTLDDKSLQSFLSDPQLSHRKTVQPTYTGDRCAESIKP